MKIIENNCKNNDFLKNGCIHMSFLMIFERAFPSPEQLQSRHHGTNAPDSAGIFVTRQKKTERGRRGPEPARGAQRDRGGRCPDGSSGEAPESDFYLITRNRRQRERKEGARASQRSPGGQTTRRDSGEVPEKEPRSRLRQRRDRPRRKLRRGPGVGWDWFSNSFPLVFLSEPIREPTK